MGRRKTVQDGNDNVTYDCEQKSFSYTIIGDNIKADFDFLKRGGELSDKLHKFLDLIQEANDNENAFSFNDTCNSLDGFYDNVKKEVDSLEGSLETLHSAFMTDIDNINAELKVNFGYWLGGTAREAGRTPRNTDNS